MTTRIHTTTGRPLNPEVVVKASESKYPPFQGTYYVLAFGRCIRCFRGLDHLFTKEEAEAYAQAIAYRHRKWAEKKTV